MGMIIHVTFQPYDGERGLCGEVLFGYTASSAERLPSHFYPPLTRQHLIDALERTTCQGCAKILHREIADRA